MKMTPVEQRIERGQVLCGTPDMVVDQITRTYDELKHGHTNLIVKIGNMPDEFINRGMLLLKEDVFPRVRHLSAEAGTAAAARLSGPVAV